MPFHKELFRDLPPEEDIRRSFESLRGNVRDADGFYALVQDIAAKYGDKAYDLAEAVFEECGMKCDAAALRMPGRVRRVGYGFDGGNIYELDVKPFEASMRKGVVRCYRNVFRQLSPAALITEDEFQERILSDPSHSPDGLLVAFNPLGMTLGFVHCCIDGSVGTVEAFAFHRGRMHEHVAPVLLSHAASFFGHKRSQTVRVFGARLKYPFYSAGRNLRADLRARTQYLEAALSAGAERSGWRWE